MRTFFVPGKGVVIFIIPFCEMTLAYGGEVLDTAIEDAETGRVSEIAINVCFFYISFLFVYVY
ncbi:hypothetical protein [Fibrobacter sp.]|uniref:hypothetical protein n=1 Tax=Fibrobacter sp. TaxID=35828 RepID=UPI0025C39E24|nr:hypothetical protein [Fibrobacter sp.]MBR3072640.1 hypothetical protein [Fibrobacter sp.]